ncbi:MAG: ribonuclease HII [Thermomicrobiales bacterium]
MAIVRPRPTLDHEAVWWQSGYPCVCGVDEVGRGALAGPLVAAAVVLPADPDRLRAELADLDDSKALAPWQREAFAVRVLSIATAVAIGVVGVDEIDEIGLSFANRSAMERAVRALPVGVDVILLDAMTIEHAATQVGLIDGDALCLSIAAASIVAKVARDRMMRLAHAEDQRYGFDRHKGYGTPGHLGALARFGPSQRHRRSFGPVASVIAAGRSS